MKWLVVVSLNFIVSMRLFRHLSARQIKAPNKLHVIGTYKFKSNRRFITLRNVAKCICGKKRRRKKINVQHVRFDCKCNQNEQLIGYEFWWMAKYTIDMSCQWIISPNDNCFLNNAGNNWYFLYISSASNLVFIVSAPCA